MKIRTSEHSKLWLIAEQLLANQVLPEQLRTSGLIAAQSRGWSIALVRLEEAVQCGVRDFQTLDALGEAVYQTKSYELLLPYSALYQNPTVSIHMARALMFLGQIKEARIYLKIASDTMLKAALEAILGYEKDIETAITSITQPFRSAYQNFSQLSFVEYWQALAPTAEVAGDNELLKLAERRLKALAYDRPVVHFNQSLRYLKEGDFNSGWKLYEWRVVPGSPCASVTKCAEISSWEGECLSGKSILVVLENGFGDQIFSLRFIEVLINEGASVEIAADASLLKVVKESFKELVVHNLKEVRETHYWKNRVVPDFWTAAFSIPARSCNFDVVGTKGFLKSSPDLQNQLAQQLAQLNPKGLPIYALIWHGDIRTEPMRTRAYSVEEILQETKVLDKPSVILSLQKDITEEELVELQAACDKAGCVLVNAAKSLEDFAVTAAWLKLSDHVYTCDTACAHLSGALAVPTTVLIRNKSIWHWIAKMDSAQSVWYDSATIQYALAPKLSYMFEIRQADLECE